MIEALTLYCVPGVGPGRFKKLVDHFGSPGAALVGDNDEFAKEADRRAEKARHGAAPARRARNLLRQCTEAGIGMLAYGSDAYPGRLGHLDNPPPVLFTLGRTELLHGPCVAVVGSRRATAYGRRVSRSLGARLAEQGRCVVSGMAMGVDAEAHRGALPGPTAAVLGSGVDVPSPTSNTRLYREILKHGVVVSEFEPGTRAEPHHFPRRNRIIAALATDVVIVEASGRSGALITADHALDVGREVHAVPGPIDRATSQGTNRLIAQGATIVTDTNLGHDSFTVRSLPGEPELRDLLAAVPGAPITVEEVAEAAGRAADEVGASLMILEIRGYVVSTRDGRVMRTPGRRPMMVREGAA
ncbi:MAG: DNA-processing protein DprA [Gemmatimonadota bacterium]|nr:DNA-processing protein DprA [Gemmatimonadota bacterium]